MKFNTIILALFTIALVQAKLIMIIRHGEKIDDDHTDLSPKGKARAQCLINVFGNTGFYATPQRIYAQNPTEKKQSTRPRDTVTPLAESLGLQVDLSFTSGQIKKLTNDIKISTDEVVLISWNNDKIPEIAEKFGIVNPPEWNNKVFDEVWMIYDTASASFRKNGLSKRLVYSGTEGYSLEIVKQDIKDCVKENTKTLKNAATSDASKLTYGLIMTLVSLIACIFVNF